MTEKQSKSQTKQPTLNSAHSKVIEQAGHDIRAALKEIGIQAGDEVAILIDTSGSIGPEQNKLHHDIVRSTLQGIEADIEPRFMGYDMAIHTKTETPSDLIDVEKENQKGTKLDDPVEDSAVTDAEVVINLTDGYVPDYPAEAPETPVIFVISNVTNPNNYNPPPEWANATIEVDFTTD